MTAGLDEMRVHQYHDLKIHVKVKLYVSNRERSKSIRNTHGRMKCILSCRNDVGIDFMFFFYNNITYLYNNILFRDIRNNVIYI